jgi:hypothetical protein
MASSLVSQIAEALGPTIVARIASALGLGESSTQKAVNAAVPGLLAALMSLVSKPQGVSKLNDVVAKQEPGLLSSLANVIGESGQKAFVDKGANTLTSLLGGSVVSALTNALGRYAGIGEGSSKSLLGLLGPAVLGILGQEQRDRGLDASGLARLLTSQKDSVLAALPSGFSKYLGEAGILDDVTTRAAKSAYRAPDQSTSPSIWPWLLGALALLAIGALLWRLLSPQPQEVVEPKSPSQIEVPYADLLTKLRGVKVGDVDVGELADSAITSLRSSLESISDESSAQKALPELTKADSQFDQLRGLLGQLSPETRKTLTDLVAAVRPSLDQLIDKALAIPGVGAVIKPAVDAIRSKLDALATA